MLILCPHCQAQQQTTKNTISDCQDCQRQFVVIDAFCLIGASRCPSQSDYLKYLAMHQVSDKSAKLLARSHRAFYCFECGHNLGTRSVRIENQYSPTRPFDGYYVVKVETFSDKIVYHGTSSERVPSIAKDGFLPPGGKVSRKNGFPSEKLLRFVGIDRLPAEMHATKEEDVVLDFRFSGVVATANIPFEGSMLNQSLDNLPDVIDGIEYVEHGRSLAVKPQAKLVLVSLVTNGVVKQKAQSCTIKKWCWSFFRK